MSKSPSLGLDGLRAVVTGGAKGLGAEYAASFVDAGARVVAVDLDVDDVPDPVVGIRADVTNEADMETLLHDVTRTIGGVDVLINNAAVYMELGGKQSLFDVSVAEWDRVMAVNARGPWQVVRALAPAMMQQGSGRIVNISSTTAFGGVPGVAHYTTSKAAVIGLTRAMARELGPHGVTVNAVAPGMIANDASAGLNEHFDEYRDRVRATRALGCDLSGSDLVGLVRFLASPASGAMTGQTIVVDGGGVMQ